MAFIDYPLLRYKHLLSKGFVLRNLTNYIMIEVGDSLTKFQLEEKMESPKYQI